MNDNLLFILIILAIIVFFLLRAKKGIKEFKDRVPNFMLFCKNNGWKLVNETTTGLMYCKEVDYDELKDKYLRVNKVPLEVPNDMIIYHYIGLYCSGDFIAISNDNRNFSEDSYRFINYISVPEIRPAEFPSKSISHFEDDVNLYKEEVDLSSQAKKLFFKINSDKENRNGFGGDWYSWFMKKQELKQWEQFANDCDTPNFFKTIILDFFIFYEISFLKYSINNDATSDPFRYLMYDTNTLFSSSLKAFQEETTMKAVGYPNWFYLAFPDVAMWAIKGEGNKIIKEQLSNLSEKEVIFNNVIRNEHLKTIINLYKQNSKKQLEVGIHSDY